MKFKRLKETISKFQSPMSKKYPDEYASSGEYAVLKDEYAMRLNAIMEKLDLLEIGKDEHV